MLTKLKFFANSKYKHKIKIEIETILNLKPLTNFSGQEYFIRYKSYNIKNSKSIFFTDSNGLMMMKRKKYINESQSVNIANNYYPVTSAIYV